MDVRGATVADLIAAQSRMLDTLHELADLRQKAFQDAERFRSGPEANDERHREALSAYLYFHESRVILHAQYLDVYEEIQRRRAEQAL